MAKKIIYILFFYSSLNLQAQYFNIEKTLLNNISFDDGTLNRNYNALKVNLFNWDQLSKFNKINAELPLSKNDEIAKYITQALEDLHLNNTKAAVANQVYAEKKSKKNENLLGNQITLLKGIVYKNLGAYEESEVLFDKCVFNESYIKHQLTYVQAQNICAQKKYTAAISLLENNLPIAKKIASYDYYKCIEFLVEVAEENNDNALALYYSIRQDSAIALLQEKNNLFNKNIFYNISTINADYIKQQKIITYNNIGLLYRKLGDNISSEKYLMQSISLLNQKKNANLLPEIETNVGLTNTYLKRYTDAEKNYQTAYASYKKTDDKFKQAQILNILAKNSFLASQPLAAITNCEESIKIASDKNDWKNLSDSYFILSEIYAYNADYNKSQMYYKEYIKAKELNEQEKNRSAKTQEEILKKVTEIETNISEEIALNEKRELEVIKIKLESAQREQELLLLKKENELKEKTLQNQQLEKNQIEKNLSLIQEQLEKQKLSEQYNAAKKERILKGIESTNFKNEIKLLNSQKTVIAKENTLKEQKLEANKRMQWFLFIGIGLITLFLAFTLYAFYRNKKQNNVIKKTVSKLEMLSTNLQETNQQLGVTISQINIQKQIIEEKNNLIIDSINYSLKIQNSFFLNDEQLAGYFNDAFIINMPRDIVSGDFYLVKNKGNKTYVAMVDCTGHGVPGSLISIIGYQEISHIIETTYLSPSKMLAILNGRINKLVNNNQSLGSDGMDVMLLEIDNNLKTLTFSGARGYLMVYANQQIKEFKGDRYSIGENSENGATFTDTQIPITEDDLIYMYTDGFQDQYSELTKKRVGNKTLKQKIEEIAKETFVKQKEELITLYKNQKGNAKQTDDITILALKPKLNKEQNSMMIENPKIREVLHTISTKEELANNLVVVYGKINQEIIISTVKLIERKLIAENFSRGIITKTKMLSTEIMQNISKHQEYNDKIAPYFILNTDKTNLWLYAGNLINNESKTYLHHNLELYKTYDKDKLRNVYLTTFQNSQISSEGNVGLGLLTILYKSNQHVKHDLIPISTDMYHYNLEVYLNSESLKN